MGAPATGASEGEPHGSRGERLKRRVLANDAANRVLTGLLRLGAAPDGARARRCRDVARCGPARAALPNGVDLRLFCERDWIGSRVFWQGWDGYEPETARWFFAQARSASCVLDIGANVGYFSLLAALANPAAKVVAVEPVPDNLRRLHRNVALNHVDNIEVIAAAAVSRSGTVSLRMRAGGFDDRATIEAFSGASRDDEHWRTETVPAVALDDLGLVDLDLVKIDVEGGEPEVLAGLTDTIERCRPVIVCELLTDASCAWVQDRFGGLGYRFSWITGDGLQPVDGPLVRPRPWRNCVFAPH